MTSRPQESIRPPVSPAAGLAPTRDGGAARAFPGGDAPYHPGPGGAPSDQLPAPAGRGEARNAMLAYLGVPFTLILLPLVIYLASLRGRPFARWHAGQALNAAVTAVLYAVCCLIIGAMLALDSLQVAAFITLPLLAVLWVGLLISMIRAAGASAQAQRYQLPRWLRVR